MIAKLSSVNDNRIDRYLRWLRQTSLPLWAAQGFDERRERFNERLDLQGGPLAIPHRAMVQARQIYSFAHAAWLGWYDQGHAIAATALRSLRRDFGRETADEASFVFSTDLRGAVISEARDSYTHAFILLALAWMYRLDGDATHLRLADRILAFVDRALTDTEHGGLFDRAGDASDTHKRQNPVMHMFEACIFLAEAAPGRGYEERAQVLVRLFETRILRQDREYFAEMFAGDWSDYADPRRAHVYEPGHLLEWSWLLERARLAGIDVCASRTKRLAATAFISIGPNALIPDEIDGRTGRATERFRLWPHTEALKVASMPALRGDVPSAGSLAALTSQNFLAGPFDGGWIDRRDATGTSLVDHVPASSLYHLVLAGASVNGPTDTCVVTSGSDSKATQCQTS